MMIAAKTLALTGMQLIDSPKLVEEARENFIKKRGKDFKYLCAVAVVMIYSSTDYLTCQYLSTLPTSFLILIYLNCDVVSSFPQCFPVLRNLLCGLFQT